MANEQNLQPSKYKLSQEEAKKGGKKSAEARRHKADVRKAIQAIIDGTYKDKSGKDVTGADILAINLFKMASNIEHKQCLASIRSIIELLGQDLSPEDKRIKKAEIKLLETKIELLSNAGQRQNEKELPMLWKALEGDNNDV